MVDALAPAGDTLDDAHPLAKGLSGASAKPPVMGGFDIEVAPIESASPAGSGGFDLNTLKDPPKAKSKAVAKPASAAKPAASDGAATPAMFNLDDLKDKPAAPTQRPPSYDPKKDIERFQHIFQGREPDVDYSSGAPFTMQVVFDKADNPDEARAVLNRVVGKGNYGQDQRGNWWVKGQDGKKVAVAPSGGIGPWIRNQAAQLAAYSPELVGGVAGAVAGAPEGGPLGAVVGAGGGAMAGKAIDETYKEALGELKKTPGELATKVAETGMLNAAAETGGPLLGAAGKGVKNFIHNFVETTPATRATTGRLVDEGFAPPLVSSAPGAKASQYEQKLGYQVVGDASEKKNTELMMNRVRRIMESEGMTPEHIDHVMSDVTSADERLSGSETGQDIQRVAQERSGEMRSQAQNATTHARELLDQSQQDFQRYAAGQHGRLGEQLAGAIEDRRREFGAAMGDAYRAVDEMAGSRKVVPITVYRNRARAIRQITSPDQLEPILNQLADAPETIMLSFKQAHELRSFFRDLARSKHTNLTPSRNVGLILQQEQEASAALDEIADFTDDVDMSEIANDNGLPREAVQALREVDAQYREGIQVYKNALVNKIVRDARDDIYPDPATIAKAIVSKGNTEQAREIMQLLPQNLRDQVARADSLNVLMRITDPQTGRIDGATLHQMMVDPLQRAVMNEVYPQEVLQRLEQMSNELRALNGELDVREIPQFSAAGIQQAIETSISRQRELDDFVRANPIRALSDADPRVVDQAADNLLKGGQESTLRSVRATLGEDSDAWRGVREYALKKVLKDAVIDTPTRSKSIAGDAVDDALKRWTAGEQDILFPEGLREDLKELAKDARFLFPHAMNDQGTSMAAAAIKSKLPFHLRAWAKWSSLKIVSIVAKNPDLLRFLANAKRTDPTTFTKVMKALSTAADKSTTIASNERISGPGNGEPSAEALTDIPQPDEKPIPVQSPPEAQALPEGTLYSTPDGQVMRR